VQMAYEVAEESRHGFPVGTIALRDHGLTENRGDRWIRRDSSWMMRREADSAGSELGLR
jgi:hypothetical protein